MRAMGLRGAVRGRAWVTTTQSRPDAPSGRADLVERHFTATRPNQLWVVGLHVRRDVARLRLRGVRDRCLRAADRRLARRRRRCAPTSSSTRSSRRSTTAATTDDRRPGASQRSRHAVSVDALHRAARRRRHRAVGRQPRRFVRQRPRRIGDRALQDGGDSTTRAVAESRGGGIRDARRGSIGSITGGCSNRSATCRRPSTKRATMSRPRWPDSHNSLSDDPGTIHALEGRHRPLPKNRCRPRGDHATDGGDRRGHRGVPEVGRARL